MGKVMYGDMPLKFSATPRDMGIKAAVEPDHDRQEILKETEGFSAVKGSRNEITRPAQATITPPLQGIKVVEVSEEIAGLYLGRSLGDAGANVIKVEPPTGDWTRALGPKMKGESALFLELNRDKRGIAIDYRTEKGKDALYRLVKDTDVFIETFRPGEADKIGLGYRHLQRINPKLIYCSISPFGTSGPYKDRSASELEIQGMSGYLWYLSELGKPPVRLGADIAAVTAAKFAFIGILAALYYRMKTGVGQKVETSMLGSLMCTGTNWLTAHYNPDYWGGWFLTGPYDHAETGYRTKDKPILFGLAFGACRQKDSWIGFCEKVGLKDLLNDPWFYEHGWRVVGAGRDAQEMKPVFETAFADKTAEELVEIIHSVGGRVGVVETYKDIFSGTQVQAVEMVQEIQHPVAGTIKTTGLPWKFSKMPMAIKRAAPTLGQHTRQVLREVGYSDSDIDILAKERIVSCGVE